MSPNGGGIGSVSVSVSEGGMASVPVTLRERGEASLLLVPIKMVSPPMYKIL